LGDSHSITDMIKCEGFFHTLFDAIPSGIAVIGADRRVHAINRAMRDSFGVSLDENHLVRNGEALHCVHAFTEPGGCGQGEFCLAHCELLRAISDALDGREVRRRAEIRVSINGVVEDRLLLVQAVPFTHGGESFALLILDNADDPTRPDPAECVAFEGIIGAAPKMTDLFATIHDLAQAAVPVLLQGESGTGKELVANALHHCGPRAGKLFVPVNCGALPEGLVESELFGHVRGAFTGAHRDKKGRFELADGGTIFLDEVTELTPAVQVKLLRVLEEGIFSRVGGEGDLTVDVRIISATNDDILAKVRDGAFREDLFYRLCVVPLSLPPLRERSEDIPILVEHFLAEATMEGITISSDALAIFRAYPWPGNVRELRNAIQYALVKCHQGAIQPEHLPPTLATVEPLPPPKRTRKHKLTPAAVAEALRLTHGNKLAAAKHLGVGRATLYRFLADK
jgi:transcriptional regulator with PAS, ATPase and Fis domain